jgi:glucose/arabinose dehydrogenase
LLAQYTGFDRAQALAGCNHSPHQWLGEQMEADMAMFRLISLLAPLAALPLASCGSDSGGTTPPPSNRPPTFTSATTASTAENVTGTVYTAAATDPDNNSLTYSMSGGADRAAFAITATGALSFTAPPDFEAPTDTDRNNIYLVQLSVSDGTASATLDLAVTVTNAGLDAFQVRRVATGLNAPLYLTALPDNSGRVLVVQKGGIVRIVNPVTGIVAPTPFLDISTTISTDGERGLLGLALAPDYVTSGTAYAYATNPSGTIEVRKFQAASGTRDRLDPATSDVIISIPHPGFSNHNGGWLDFGPDGNLYLGVGDGGGGGDPNGNAQNPNALLGKMLRIDPSRDSYPTDPLRDYGIPTGNPYATSGGAPEIWMSGMRNPFRAGFDRTTGNLYIGDVGQGAIEEIDLVPSGANGLNFGWNLREGTEPYAGGATSASFTNPVAEYGHGSGPTQGNSVTGGYVYRGPVEALQGKYFFGDFVSANIWSVPVAQLVQGQTVAANAFTQRRAAFTPITGTINNISSFGLDQVGNFYIVDYDGEVYIVEATQGSL